MKTITLSNSFDAGAIEVVRAENAQDIALNLRNDNAANLAQWFYFRVQGAAGQTLKIQFLNASQSAYPKGWEGYRVCASYDNQNWFRIDSNYDGVVLQAQMRCEFDSVYFAYFEPYSWSRHQALLGKMQTAGAQIQHLGKSLQGREIDALLLGQPQAAHKIWVIARQHPGETMAEWFVEGLLEALTDAANPCAQKLLQHAQFYVVPNMNPDGSVLGNLRTNAVGTNLNREWMTPSLEKSPEVLCVKNAIHQTGCNVFLDVHGDEAIPYNFISGCEMLDNITPAQTARQQAFVQAFKTASPDFQDKYGYAASRYSADVLSLASKYVGHTFGCLSVTLELPFKDNADLPNLQVGWNGARSKALGAAVLQALWADLQSRF